MRRERCFWVSNPVEDRNPSHRHELLLPLTGEVATSTGSASFATRTNYSILAVTCARSPLGHYSIIIFARSMDSPLIHLGYSGPTFLRCQNPLHCQNQSAIKSRVFWVHPCRRCSSWGLALGRHLEPPQTGARSESMLREFRVARRRVVVRFFDQPLVRVRWFSMALLITALFLRDICMVDDKEKVPDETDEI